MSWERVIGLEVHVQLATSEKLFCADPASFGAPPNTHVCPVCLGLPGALPVLNKEAVDLAVTAALALGCEVHSHSVFERKSYFYPDLPKGYQVTQAREPLATAGSLAVGTVPNGRSIRIRQLHLEEDAGKSVHDRFSEGTGVDLNRAGVPLIEIVTEPDLRSPTEARAFLGGLKRTLQYLEVSDCNMERGSLRVDANVSLRPRGSAELGVKAEVKNLNSFSAVERALEGAVERQEEALEAGGLAIRETLRWDEGSGALRALRSKEEIHDYRYFPDPDLLPLRIDAERVARARDALPELPLERQERFVRDHSLPETDAGVLTSSRALADYFEELASHVGDASLAANWARGALLREVNRVGRDVASLGPAPADLAELVGLVRDGTLSHAMGSAVLRRMVDSGRGALEIVEREDLAQVRETGQLERWIDGVLARSPQEVERYRQGEERLLGYFIGRVMRTSGGRADPRFASELLKKRLSR